MPKKADFIKRNAIVRITEGRAMNNVHATDSEIVELLWARDERALSEISSKYSGLYIGIIRNALGNECDVQECADDLLLGVWNSIPPNRPDNLTAYIARLARRIGITRFRHNTRKKRSEGQTVILSELSECIQTVPDSEGDGELAGLSEIISEFLGELDPEMRILFVRRYFYLESVASLAERFGLSENAVSVRLHRTRKKLEKALRKEGIEI